MSVFVIIACLTSWADYTEANDCQVIEVYSDHLAAKIRASELAEFGTDYWRKYRVLTFKVKK